MVHSLPHRAPPTRRTAEPIAPCVWLQVHEKLRKATFCLEPQGDTPTRSQIFECLLSGGIQAHTPCTLPTPCTSTLGALLTPRAP